MYCNARPIRRLTTGYRKDGIEPEMRKEEDCLGNNLHQARLGQQA